MVRLSDIQSRRDRILAIALRHGANRVRVFGSVSQGTATPTSDLDLLVHLEDGRTLLDQIALTHELEDLLGCSVDVVDDQAVHPILEPSILAGAVEL
jgi:predicted nucleotidyltransferase